MNISIKNILLATDFSHSAKQAQRYALALAIPQSAQLHVLHVVNDPSPLPGVTGLTLGPPANLLSQIVKNAEAQLDIEVAEDRQRYPSICCAVRTGDPVRQILDYAHAHGVDMIILGTHGRTRLSHLIIGSVAEKLVRIAKCPVLTVHSDDQTFVLDASTNGK